MSARLQIGGVDIPAGSQRLVELRLPLLYTHTPVVLSAQVTRGRRDGPCLFVCAAVHGDEINGV
ncbi:MAG: succinylglutamate desuccinylase, partial [Chromatiaceae bacterium]|nr:succinylglutamate desuccinylase [Chromatiaceae bacterium]